MKMPARTVYFASPSPSSSPPRPTLRSCFLHVHSFHNWDHTLDALHAVWWLMRRGIATRVSKLEILGALTASICLCLDHPGVGNPFLVSSHSPLALTYNDESPLQSHAAAAAFALMNRDDGACDILIHLNDAQVRSFPPPLLFSLSSTSSPCSS